MLIFNLYFLFNSKDSFNEKKIIHVNEQLFLLQNFINECERLNITPTEYAYLKLISLFDSDAISLNYFIQSQISNHNNINKYDNNFGDINKNQLSDRSSFEIAQKLLSHKDKVQAYKILACKELRKHVENKIQQHIEEDQTSSSALTLDHNEIVDSNEPIISKSDKFNVHSPTNNSNESLIDSQQQQLKQNSSQNKQETSSLITAIPSNTFDTKMEMLDPERVERLLLRLNSLKKLDNSVMEELFFNDALGNVQIDYLIPSILGVEQV
jgi:hypothetical protein